MQSFIASLRCVDCKDNQFISAASLLSHFAQHIIDYDANEVPGGDPHWVSPGNRKRSSESILEQVLKRSVSRHSISDGHQTKAVTVLVPVRSPLQTAPSSYSADSSGEGSLTPPPPGDKDGGSRCSSASSYSSSASGSGGGGPKQVSLAKFDMQQRLESCVLNLVSKREQAELWDGGNHAEELNPLTLCTVTIEEGETDMDIDGRYGLEPARKISNRKQQKPKKIARHVNGMLNELSAKLPENTTITIKSPEPEKTSSPPKKKYPCHICTKVFGWSTDLKRHILIHTGERPFKCRHCTSCFTRNFLLQKHEKKVHCRGVSLAKDSAMLIAVDKKVFAKTNTNVDTKVNTSVNTKAKTSVNTKVNTSVNTDVNTDVITDIKTEVNTDDINTDDVNTDDVNTDDVDADAKVDKKVFANANTYADLMCLANADADIKVFANAYADIKLFADADLKVFADTDAEGDAEVEKDTEVDEGNLVICEDDRSSADENDNHTTKRSKMDSVLSGRCANEEHWRADVLPQEAMNS